MTDREETPTPSDRPRDSSSGFFLVSVHGQIERLEDFTVGDAPWYCRYQIVSGPDWRIVGGLEGGLSQLASAGGGRDVVFNMPLECLFKSTNPYGWPQVVVSVYKNQRLEGYGRAHVPPRPGRWVVKMQLARPEPSTMLGSILGIFGYRPELLQPAMLASAEGINLIRMKNRGTLHLSLDVLAQGLQTFGYDIARDANQVLP